MRSSAGQTRSRLGRNGTCFLLPTANIRSEFGPPALATTSEHVQLPTIDINRNVRTEDDMDYIDTLNSLFGNDVTVRDGKLSVSREGALSSDKMDTLVRAAVFGESDERDYARW